MTMQNENIIGVWYERCPMAGLPSIDTFIVHKNPYPLDKERILTYLEGGEENFMFYVLDFYKPLLKIRRGQKTISTSFFTDGKWMWTEEMVYYFKHLNYILPEVFVSEIREKKYEIPILSKPVIKELKMNNDIFFDEFMKLKTPSGWGFNF